MVNEGWFTTYQNMKTGKLIEGCSFKKFAKTISFRFNSFFSIIDMTDDLLNLTDDAIPIFASIIPSI